MNGAYRCTLLLLCLGILSACSTMRFTQETSLPAQDKVHKHWHHTVLNGVVEISRPVNLYRDCKGKPWQEAKVEFKFLNGLAAGAINLTIDALLLSPNFVTPYSPWAVDVTCSQ